MNQRSLAVVNLVPITLAAITTNTNHTAVDMLPTAGNANIGRREMKCTASVLMTANTTSDTIKLQDNTTSDTTGFADITGAAFTAATTSGELTPIHFTTNKRYIRAVSTVAGTTPSVQQTINILVEQRAS